MNFIGCLGELHRNGKWLYAYVLSCFILEWELSSASELQCIKNFLASKNKVISFVVLSETRIGHFSVFCRKTAAACRQYGS